MKDQKDKADLFPQPSKNADHNCVYTLNYNIYYYINMGHFFKNSMWRGFDRIGIFVGNKLTDM